MNKKGVYKNLFIIFICIVLGFILGKKVNSFTEMRDVSVMLEGEVQSFRNAEGKVLNILERDNIFYLPVDGRGGYLNYMTIQNEKGLFFEDTVEKNKRIFEGMNTETIYGEVVTDSIFSNSDYTCVLFMATWCNNCKEMVSMLEEFQDYFNKNNIQLVSVVTDIAKVSERELLSDEDIEIVANFTKSLNFDYILLRDEFLDNNFIKGSISLPKLYIIDSNGYLIKILGKGTDKGELNTVFSNIIE